MSKRPSGRDDKTDGSGAKKGNQSVAALQPMVASILRSLVLYAAGVITVLAPSAWKEVVESPKITGTILAVSVGHSRDIRVGRPTEVASVFVCLSNPRATPVSPVDYEMEAHAGEAWVKLKPWYAITPNLHLSFAPGELTSGSTTLTVESVEDFLLHNLAKPIVQGEPRMGFLLFPIPQGVGLGVDTKVRLWVHDNYGNRHLMLQSRHGVDPRAMPLLMKSATVQSDSMPRRPE